MRLDRVADPEILYYDHEMVTGARVGVKFCEPGGNGRASRGGKDKLVLAIAFCRGNPDTERIPAVVEDLDVVKWRGRGIMPVMGSNGYFQRITPAVDQGLNERISVLSRGFEDCAKEQECKGIGPHVSWFRVIGNKIGIFFDSFTKSCHHENSNL